MFFFDKDYVTECQNATTEDEKNSVPGFGYMQKILMFFKHHFCVGELFMEYVKHSCNQEKNLYASFVPLTVGSVHLQNAYLNRDMMEIILGIIRQCFKHH